MTVKKSGVKALPIEDLIEKIRDKHGKESVMKLVDRGDITIPTYSTGSWYLDKATGIGGLPVGRIVEIIGPESSGKTTICLHVMANAQKQGKECAIIDVEHALDPSYAAALGVDVNKLLISQPDCGEDALSIAEMMINSNNIGVVVVDSVAALVPRAELEGEMGDRHVGTHARLMAQAMRKLAGIAKKSDTLIIFTNQIRYKIGIMFGSPETTPGGNSLKFFASMRLDIRITKQVKDNNKEGIANEVKIKVIKNKLAPPCKLAQTTITYGKGFDTISEFLTLAIEAGEIVKKKNTFYTQCGTKIGLGVEKTKAYLRKRPEQVEAMRKYILTGEQ